MGNRMNVKTTLIAVLAAGAGLAGCVADPYYGDPGYNRPPGYSQSWEGPQTYGPPGYPAGYAPNSGPGYYPAYSPAYYPPVVVEPSIGIGIGFDGGHRR
jgi:hypothetical protein